jgi:hypothetical protein
MRLGASIKAKHRAYGRLNNLRAANKTLRIDLLSNNICISSFPLMRIGSPCMVNRPERENVVLVLPPGPVLSMRGANHLH